MWVCGTVSFARSSLIGRWNLRDFDLYGLQPGDEGGLGCLIKSPRCCTPLCWVINLAVRTVIWSIFSPAFTLLSLFILTAQGCKYREKGGLALWCLRPNTTHVITWSELFDDECSEWRRAPEICTAAHLYLPLIGSRTRHTVDFLSLRKDSLCNAKYILRGERFCQLNKWTVAEAVLGVCWHGRSVHVWGRGQGAELMFPDPASSNSSGQSIVMRVGGFNSHPTVLKLKLKAVFPPREARTFNDWSFFSSE